MRPFYAGDPAALSREKLTHLLIMVIREAGLSCHTYGDDYGSSSSALSVLLTHALLRYGLSVFAPFTTFWVFLFKCLFFHHNHSVRGLQFVIICSSYFPDVANDVLSG
jgi:hypothetical protein